MIMEDFISFDLAKKLKKKGFPQHITDEAYIVDNYGEEYYYIGDRLPIPLIPDYMNDVAAPTISQVLKWLREVKDIDLIINPIFFYDDNLSRMRDYECEVLAPLLNKPEHCGYHKKWEQATIAGIEYVLENLI